MKIVLSGVETNNKGAELMLYAILQEVERKDPNAEVYISSCPVSQDYGYVKTNLRLKNKPMDGMMKIITKLHLRNVFIKLRLNKIFGDNYAIKRADYFLDGSGFKFSDQWSNMLNDQEYKWEHLLKRQKAEGTKIIFLPQAFGPFEKSVTKRVMQSINKYADLIMPREEVSFDYIKRSGLVNMNKVRRYTDFTALVHSECPSEFKRLEGAVCVIPNQRMIDKGIISEADYLSLLCKLIKLCNEKGKQVYLLNHEGKKDELLAYKCKKKSEIAVDVVSGLNALDTKGLISSAYLVITSRFHGLASSLNSCVPAFSTSWSHKYTELYKDYGISDMVLPLDNVEKSLSMVAEVLCQDKNQKIRDVLKEKTQFVQYEIKQMWNDIWNV